jgi:hypothetical protein
LPAKGGVMANDDGTASLAENDDSKSRAGMASSRFNRLTRAESTQTKRPALRAALLSSAFGLTPLRESEAKRGKAR